MSETFECRDCGREYEFEGERITCWCNKEATEVVRPCANCGDPITTCELCTDCGEKLPGDAVTPTWGT